MDANKYTDRQLKSLEKRITREYKQAGDELAEKARRYWIGYIDDNGVKHQGFYERKAREYEAYTKGIYTDNQYKAWMYSQLGRGKHWEELKSQMTDRLADAQKIAQGYANDLLPNIYCANSNEVARIAQKSATQQGVLGVSFQLADEHTIKRLMEGSREIQPFSKIDINLPRINQWNMTKLQDALLQGIMQGESIDNIADRFEKVANMNRAQSIRSARTAVTGAQSAGKQDRYDELQELGAYVTKVWVATNDERTREEHAEADGQEVPVDYPFDVGGEELMYPADENGSPWNIYNCRCTMHTGRIVFRK